MLIFTLSYSCDGKNVNIESKHLRKLKNSELKISE